MEIEEIPEDGMVSSHYDPFEIKMLKQKINELIRESNKCKKMK